MILFCLVFVMVALKPLAFRKSDNQAKHNGRPTHIFFIQAARINQAQLFY